MPTSKAQAIALFTQEDEKKYDQLIKEVEKAILSYYGRGFSVYANSYNMKVIDRVMKTYEALDWHVEYNSGDQRDGSFITFS